MNVGNHFGLAKPSGFDHSYPHRAPKALGADLDDGKVTIAPQEHDEPFLTSQDAEGSLSGGPTTRCVKLFETGKEIPSWLVSTAQ